MHTRINEIQKSRIEDLEKEKTLLQNGLQQGVNFWREHHHFGFFGWMVF